MEELLYRLWYTWLTWNLCLSVLIVVPACFGLHVGLRFVYIHILRLVFYFGRQTIAKRKYSKKDSDSEQHELPNLIEKQIPTNIRQAIEKMYNAPFEEIEHEFHLVDSALFIKAGIESIVEDEVTKRFSAAELNGWNLLTRTNQHYRHISWRLTLLYFIGMFIRYFLLVPLRINIFLIGFVFTLLGNFFCSLLPIGRRTSIQRFVSLTSYRILVRAMTAVVRFHNPENRATQAGITVANHTSPIDVAILQTDNCYALIGQKHSGFIGLFQQCMSASGVNHVWFERSEANDREKVRRKLAEQVSNPNNFPFLIFPEGTCINNTSVMQFKKGSFEISEFVYPVAIKYNSTFSEPFWNSSRESFLGNLLNIMTSWALVCDVWYLPRASVRPGEGSVAFANRVKGDIASCGGLVDLLWDGQLKRYKVKQHQVEEQKLHMSQVLKTE